MMIRLSFHGHWKNSYPQSWLKLLHHFFGEILHQSFLVHDAGFKNCLEESPFFVCSAEVDKSYAGHLQRQAIFLLFKCSLTRACVGEASREYSCKDETVSSSFGHLGLLETFAWLQRWFPLDKFQNYRNYSESCSSFASSFLQLYMEEVQFLNCNFPYLSPLVMLRCCFVLPNIYFLSFVLYSPFCFMHFRYCFYKFISLTYVVSEEYFNLLQLGCNYLYVSMCI